MGSRSPTILGDFVGRSLNIYPYIGTNSCARWLAPPSLPCFGALNFLDIPLKPPLGATLLFNLFYLYLKPLHIQVVDITWECFLRDNLTKIINILFIPVYLLLLKF